MEAKRCLWAAVSETRAHLVHGIAPADSIATDAHKWLNVPYDSGIVFTAHPASHRRAMTLGAAYIIESAKERDPHEYVPEESRRARAVPLYAALRTMGRDGFVALVERCCTLATRLENLLRADVGAGKVLAGLVRRIEPDIATRSVGGPGDIEEFLKDV